MIYKTTDFKGIAGCLNRYEQFETTGKLSGYPAAVELEYQRMTDTWRTIYQQHKQDGRVGYTVMSYLTPIAWYLHDDKEWVVVDKGISQTTDKHITTIDKALRTLGYA